MTAGRGQPNWLAAAPSDAIVSQRTRPEPLRSRKTEEMRTCIAARVLVPVAAVGLLFSFVGCATTNQVSEAKRSGFLGGDYALLQKVGTGRADYYYIDKSVNWADYTKVWVKPVEVWTSDDPESGLARMSQESKQMLADTLHVALVGNLTNNYQLVDHGGPGVLVIKAAVTEARPAKPVGGVLSSLYLPLRVASYGKRLVTGADVGIVDAVVEASITDGQSGQPIAAVMDERVGPRALPNQYGNRWEDVKASFDWWAQILDRRLTQAKTGNFSVSPW